LDILSPTSITTGHVGDDSIESSLHTIFVSCELLRGKDIGELLALFKDNLNAIYEDLILNNDDEFQPLQDLIDYLVASIVAADSHNA
jgi:hypothetical protein